MSWYRSSSLLVIVAAFSFVAVPARPVSAADFYCDDFESYAVGAHPAIWHEIWGYEDDVVTNEWSASGSNSYFTVSLNGSWIKRPIIRLADVGAWPLPDHFSYECTLHMEANLHSTGVVGFFFKDPRYGGQVPYENAVAFRANGGIIWEGPAGITALGSWNPGQEATYHVRVEIDFPHETADVWIDGTLAGDGLPAYPKTIPASSLYGTEIPLDKWGFALAANWGGGDPGRVFADDICLGEYAAAIPATVDIEPSQLRTKSKAEFVTGYIELPEGNTVRDIDIASVRFSAVGRDGQVSAELTPVSVGDDDGDGIEDLVVKFKREAVQNLFGQSGEYTVSISGLLKDGRPFTGTDTIIVGAAPLDLLRTSAKVNRQQCESLMKTYAAVQKRGNGYTAAQNAIDKCREIARYLAEKSIDSPYKEFIALMGGTEVDQDHLFDFSAVMPTLRWNPLADAAYGNAGAVAAGFATLAEYFGREEQAWEAEDDSAIDGWLRASEDQIEYIQGQVEAFEQSAAGALNDPELGELIGEGGLVPTTRDQLSAVLNCMEVRRNSLE